MFQLTNADLTVELLDPVAERSHLGSRFCAGGYVWQVHDRVAGPLLRGPEWPTTFPMAFNGQGLPESFRHRSLDGKPFTWRGASGIGIGAGDLSSDPRGGVMLIVPCQWEIERAADRLRFHTQHGYEDMRYELTRTVELNGRALRSASRLTNTGAARLKLQWFAHPFFTPRVDRSVVAELPEGTTLAENPGFALTGRMLGQTRRFMHRDDGHMDRVQLPAGRPLVATMPHPTIGAVTFETSYAPDSCIIWGNDQTFSIEPYQELDLAPGDTREWDVRYGFGAPA